MRDLIVFAAGFALAALLWPCVVVWLCFRVGRSALAEGAARAGSARARDAAGAVLAEIREGVARASRDEALAALARRARGRPS